MTSTRLLTLAVLSACLVAAVPAWADDGGGAIVAPTAEPAEVVAEPAAPAAPAEPPAEVAQTPTTPEGEEQPPGEENGDEQPPSEENGNGEGTGTGGGTGGGTAGGELPRTGFEVAALSAIGLGLLLAGAALWPTSSWPPPRNRLSRSAPRR